MSSIIPGYVLNYYYDTQNTTYTSELLDFTGYSQMQIELLAGENGLLTETWYRDIEMTSVLRIFSHSYIASAAYTYFSSPVYAPFVEFTYEPTGSTYLYIGIRRMLSSLSGDIIGVSDFIAPNASAIITRSVITGQNNDGKFKNVIVSQEGHLETSIYGPLLPFGSIHVEKLTPVFQIDAVYGINLTQTVSQCLGGSVTSSNSEFVISSGTTAYGYSFLQSRKRLRYKPGQGVVSRFNVKFSTSVPYSYQLAGLGHTEDGIFFGYVNPLSTSFGIFYVTKGSRAIVTLTIATGSDTEQSVLVTLNNQVYNIPVTASSVAHTVCELSKGNYVGWTAYPLDNTVVFVRNNAINVDAGVFSITGGSVVGSFVQTKLGYPAIKTFIPQSSWNFDKLDGTGSSGITLDPKKGNLYEIGLLGHGYGNILCKIKVTSANNSSTMIMVHNINGLNVSNDSLFRNPSFPFSILAYSVGTTTNVSVICPSFAGFVEGDQYSNGNSYNYTATSDVVGTTLLALLTVMNMGSYAGQANQSVVSILSISAITTSPTFVTIIRNGNLIGSPVFTNYSVSSCTSWDTSATSVTVDDNHQIVWTGLLSQNGQLEHIFTHASLLLQPGDYITIAAKGFGTGNSVSVSLNTQEDQ